jgi:hypothetical protein
MRQITFACLLCALLIPGFADSWDQQGAIVEVQTQNNDIVKLELREVAPSPRSGSLLFTKKLEATPEEMAWYEIALGPKTKETGRLREIRIADEPLKLKSESGELFFYPVVIVTGTETEGRSASWHWVGEKLSGVSQAPGQRPRPVSISISNIKVVRFPQP